MSAFCCILASVAFTEALPVFRAEKDRFWEKERSDSAIYSVYETYPGQKPFKGAEDIRLHSASPAAGKVTVGFSEWPAGKNSKTVYREFDWAEEMTFSLDPAKMYQFRDISVKRTERAPSLEWNPKFSGFEARRNGTEAEALLVEIETGNPFFIVRDGCGERAVLRVTNRADAEIKFKLPMEMICSSGATNSVEISAAMPARATREFALPEVKSKGVWYVKGNLRAGDGSVASVDSRFAVMDYHGRTPKQSRDEFRLGINYHMNRYSVADERFTLDALVACGAKLMRGQLGLHMAHVQSKGPDSWNFAGVDRRVLALEAAGISIFSESYYTPVWAVTERWSTNLTHWARNISPPRPGTLGKFCETAAKRYGTRIDFYECGNEWDLTFPESAESAVAVQKEFYEGIKRGCPDACVLPNGWAQADNAANVVRSGHTDFHEKFLKLGGWQYTDFHTIHLHGGFSEYVTKIRDEFFPLRKRTGSDSKQWLAGETAVTSVWDERETARCVWKKILWSWSQGAKDYIWYNLKATGWDPKDSEQGYGLLAADFRPREGYVAFSSLATVFGGGRFSRTIFDKASRTVLEFTKNGDIVIAAWDGNAQKPVAVEFSSDASKAFRVDIWGNREELKITGGKCLLKFNKDPCALVLLGAKNVTPDMEALNEFPPPEGEMLVVGQTCEDANKPDFVLADSSQVTDFYQADAAQVARLWKGPEDLSAKIWLSKMQGGINVMIRIVDDVYVTPPRGEAQWKGDDVQIAFGSHLQTGHWEFGLGLGADGKGEVVCWISPSGYRAAEAAGKVKLTASRVGDTTVYDAFFPLDVLGFDEKTITTGFRFNAFVNDNDGDGRDAAIEIRKGNFGTKNAGIYPLVRFN